MLFSEPKIPQTLVLKSNKATTVKFQCSSASRKFLKPSRRISKPRDGLKFQCSSASRKFLKQDGGRHTHPRVRGFSALQRAENSSNKTEEGILIHEYEVSVLFSEPKIPQTKLFPSKQNYGFRVSVLFSEPKIPQRSSTVALSATLPVSVLFSEPKIPQRFGPALVPSSLT